MAENAKLFAALNAAMQECGYVQKTGKNDFHKYSYASETDLMESIRPAMVKNGLMLIPNQRRVWVDTGRTFVKIDYTLAHSSGECFGPVGAIGEAQDKGDKATYKAITGAHKYIYYKLFAIATGDDPEADSETDKAAAQPKAKPAPKAAPKATTKPAPKPTGEPTWREIWPIGVRTEYKCLQYKDDPQRKDVYWLKLDYDGIIAIALYQPSTDKSRETAVMQSNPETVAGVVVEGKSGQGPIPMITKVQFNPGGCPAPIPASNGKAGA